MVCPPSYEPFSTKHCSKLPLLFEPFIMNDACRLKPSRLRNIYIFQRSIAKLRLNDFYHSEFCIRLRVKFQQKKMKFIKLNGNFNVIYRFSKLWTVRFFMFDTKREEVIEVTHLVSFHVAHGVYYTVHTFLPHSIWLFRCVHKKCLSGTFLFPFENISNRCEAWTRFFSIFVYLLRNFWRLYFCISRNYIYIEHKIGELFSQTKCFNKRPISMHQTVFSADKAPLFY